MKNYFYFILSILIFTQFEINAQDSISVAQLDTLTTKELPLKPARKISFTTEEGTWLSVDVSPDGKHIIFDMMGDLYRIPVSGGKAEKLTIKTVVDIAGMFIEEGPFDRSSWC